MTYQSISPSGGDDAAALTALFAACANGDTIELVPTASRAEFLIGSLVDWTGKDINILARGAQLVSHGGYSGPLVIYGAAVGQRNGLSLHWDGGLIVGGMIVQNVSGSKISPDGVYGTLELRTDTALAYNTFDINFISQGACCLLINLVDTEANGGQEWANKNRFVHCQMDPAAAIVVTAGGSGYTSAPTVSFTGGGGAGAMAVAVVAGGKVIDIYFTDRGHGYTSVPDISVTGGGGTGATAVTSVMTDGTLGTAVIRCLNASPYWYPGLYHFEDCCFESLQAAMFDSLAPFYAMFVDGYWEGGEGGWSIGNLTPFSRATFVVSAETGVPDFLANDPRICAIQATSQSAGPVVGNDAVVHLPSRLLADVPRNVFAIPLSPSIGTTASAISNISVSVRHNGAVVALAQQTTTGSVGWWIDSLSAPTQLVVTYDPHTVAQGDEFAVQLTATVSNGQTLVRWWYTAIATASGGSSIGYDAVVHLPSKLLPDVPGNVFAIPLSPSIGTAASAISNVSVSVRHNGAVVALAQQTTTGSVGWWIDSLSAPTQLVVTYDPNTVAQGDEFAVQLTATVSNGQTLVRWWYTAVATASGGGSGGGSGAIFAETTVQNLTSAATAIAVVDGAPITPIASSSPLTLAATPTIAAGRNGQLVEIVNEGSNPITLQDMGTLGGSGLRLGAPTRELFGDRGTIELIYDSVMGGWIETGFDNVVAFVPAVTLAINGQSALIHEVGSSTAIDAAPIFTMTYVGVPTAASIAIS